MEDPYCVVDIETCPINLEKYKGMNDEERKKLLNPIDSRIIAIGLRHQGESTIFFEEDEQKMLDDFWSHLKIIRQAQNMLIVGFSICNFDMPFLVTRSFIHGTPISPFSVNKTLVDIRDKISAYRYGDTRGKLKEYASIIGIPIEDGVDGSMVANLFMDKNYDKIKKYLESDLMLTDELFKRIRTTNIFGITRY